MTSNLQLQLGGVWLPEVVTKRSHVHSGLRPLQHQDRSLPLYTPSPARSRPPTRGQCPGAMPQRGEPSQPGSQGGSKGDGLAQRPRKNQIEPRERSGRVREVFHRRRGGEPTASSTGRRACTGGQRQSYKRAGYLTRSSGLVSRGLGETATEPHSSSWKDRRCFLEGKGGAVAPEAPHWASTHHPRHAGSVGGL